MTGQYTIVKLSILFYFWLGPGLQNLISETTLPYVPSLLKQT